MPSVQIFDIALGAHDANEQLQVVQDKTGRLTDAYHSLVAFEATPTLRISGEIPVQCRTLDSLVAEGTLPERVGILKVDTERGDLAVLHGMGRLHSDAVMLEYWDDLPETVGPSTYRVSDVVELMAGRGYSNYVVVKRHAEFESLLLNDDQTRPGEWGNVIFVHDQVFPVLSSFIFQTVATAQTKLVDKAQFFAGEAEKRLAIIEREEIGAAQAPATLKRLRVEIKRKERIIADLAATAEERLRLIELHHAEAERMRGA
jgi:FkbM family methyltransferase